MNQSTFTLQSRNPDVLTCIANLSNDEVFTPPELANQMLDTVENAWADGKSGANIWADPDVKFLDPFTKSGVFLREIVKRLVVGLADEIPNLDDRVDHILTKQVFGIAITELTSLLARRSLYCSKWANGKHAIAKSFTSESGNVWFERIEHTWVRGKCKFCGASQQHFDRGGGLETHAYAFIHTDDVKARLADLFGDNMKFDVVIGNPPYQMSDDGHGSSATTIYHRFVEQAIALQPVYLTMVTPSRWFAGGKGVDQFRADMLTGGHIRKIVDYPNSAELFPSVDIKGGVSYFLWDGSNSGDCDFSVVRKGKVTGPDARKLDEYDVLVRDQLGLNVLRKVLASKDKPLSAIISARWAFGTELTSNFTGYYTKKRAGSLRLYMQGGERDLWVDPAVVIRNEELIDKWKVLLPKAGPGNSGGHVVPDMVLGRPIVAEPGSVCTLTYLVAGPFADASACESFSSYVRTRFARFVVSLRKPSQDAPRGVYTWVPQQTWDRIWTDDELYTKYGITSDEVEYIESMIRPMDSPDE